MRVSFKNCRIAIFEPNKDLATNPTLTCLIESLAEEGARIDVIMPFDSIYPQFKGFATIYPYPEKSASWKGNLKETLKYLAKFLRTKKNKPLMNYKKYDLIMGINSEGLVKSYQFARQFEIPLVYISFEMAFRDEISDNRDILEKQSECTACQYADLVIIQDKLRAGLLAVENKISSKKFDYLPVSPSGLSTAKKTNYFHTRFNISGDKTIILHSGSFRSWTCAEELVESASSWPDNYVLVVHTRYKPIRRDEHIKIVQDSRLSNLVLSTEPLDINEYEQLVASADIGLVLYKSVANLKYTGKNLQNIGLSSGKFSFYMKCGLPVITYRQKSYEELLKSYSFGINIQNFNDMPDAINKISNNYSHFSDESRRLYSEKLDFNIHWPKISKRFLEIMQ
jgi:glycosyltransferase involved in cell wall biosynthesis